MANNIVVKVEADQILELALEQIHELTLENLQLRAGLESSREAGENLAESLEKQKEEWGKMAYRALEWRRKAEMAESVMEEREKQRDRWRERALGAESLVNDLQKVIESQGELLNDGRSA